MAIARTDEDYKQQLAALLPPGTAWNIDDQPDLHNLLGAIAKEFARLDGRAVIFYDENFLDTFHESLPDWERELGLPDECLGTGGTISERKDMVRLKTLELGGQTPAYYEQLAARFGYPNAKVKEFRASRFGRSRFGLSNFGSWSAQFMWVLKAGKRQASGSRFGLTAWGERFGGNPSDVLICVIRRAAPAHTLEFVEFN